MNFKTIMMISVIGVITGAGFFLEAMNINSAQDSAQENHENLNELFEKVWSEKAAENDSLYKKQHGYDTSSEIESSLTQSLISVPRKISNNLISPRPRKISGSSSPRPRKTSGSGDYSAGIPILNLGQNYSNPMNFRLGLHTQIENDEKLNVQTLLNNQDFILHLENFREYCVSSHNPKVLKKFNKNVDLVYQTVQVPKAKSLLINKSTSQMESSKKNKK